MELNIQYRLNIITANDNNEINKEPAKILIDNRLDKVKDCKIIEKDSSINKIIKNSSILVKNKYNRYATRIKPKFFIIFFIIIYITINWYINSREIKG